MSNSTLGHALLILLCCCCRARAFNKLLSIFCLTPVGLCSFVLVSPAVFRHIAEAAPLIERLGLVEDPDKFSPAAPSKCFIGSYQGATVSVVTNGKCARFGVDQIGTVAAGLSTWLSVEVSYVKGSFNCANPLHKVEGKWLLLYLTFAA